MFKFLKNKWGNKILFSSTLCYTFLNLWNKNYSINYSTTFPTMKIRKKRSLWSTNSSNISQTLKRLGHWVKKREIRSLVWLKQCQETRSLRGYKNHIEINPYHEWKRFTLDNLINAPTSVFLLVYLFYNLIANNI